MKSGMPMVTASMFLPSLSNMTRKSLYFAALGKRARFPAARLSSTSHKATMFSVRAAASRSAPPWPPQPTAATFSFS